MSNRVIITFEFDGLPDGSDEDLLSDALTDLESIIERVGFQGSSTKLSLEVEVNGVGGPDGTHYSAAQADVRVEISRMNEPIPSTERVKLHGWRDHGEHELAMGDSRHKCRLFTKGGCQALVSNEDHGKGRMRWHLSILREDRYPGWDEIIDARYALLPMGLTFAQILPPPNQYTNIHSNCFHLWEIDDGEW